MASHAHAGGKNCVSFHTFPSGNSYPSVKYPLQEEDLNQSVGSCQWKINCGRQFSKETVNLNVT